MERTGLTWLGVKNPETVAEHTIICAFAAWVLGRLNNLNAGRLIKAALSHDLCEVYSGDMTPFWGILPEEKKARKEFLKRWICLPVKEKEARNRERFSTEKKCLLKLTGSLGKKTEKEILNSWLDYEKRFSREGKFARQVDQIEGMLEAIYHLGKNKRAWVTPWWEEAEETIDDKILLDFLKVIQKKFYGKKLKNYRQLQDILDFILEIWKVKKMARHYWNLRHVKKPETVAGHIFTLTIMAWVLGRKKKLNMEKLLKMALCHELSAVYTGDTTQYDSVLPKNLAGREKILKKMLRMTQKEKQRIFLRDFRQEKKSLEKLTRKLMPSLRREMLQLWREYRTRSSREGYFLSQLNVSAVLLQGLLYEKKDKNFSSAPLWEWAFEISDDPAVCNLLREMKKKFC